MKFKTHPREANLYLVTREGTTRVCEFTTVATETVLWPKSLAQSLSIRFPEAYILLQWRHLRMDVISNGKFLMELPPNTIHLKRIETHDTFKYLTDLERIQK